MAPPAPQRPPSLFQPRFTLGVLYLFAFFFLYCMALAAPALYQVFQGMPPGPEQEEAARRATQEALHGRLWMAFAAAVVTTALGIRKRLLPGTRSWH